MLDLAACGQAALVVSPGDIRNFHIPPGITLHLDLIPSTYDHEHDAYLQAGLHMRWCLAVSHGRPWMSLSGWLDVGNTSLSTHGPSTLNPSSFGRFTPHLCLIPSMHGS